MRFSILYVEDDDGYFKRFEEALGTEWTGLSEIQLLVRRAESPEVVGKKLSLEIDLVLADVLFDDPKTGEKDRPRIGRILKEVRKWSEEQDADRELPIVAYTRRSKAAFKTVLEERANLYDIWDKTTAPPEYAVWRLKKLAIRLRRDRPDFFLTRLVREMPVGSQWHNHVVDMAARYDGALSEADQIARAGTALLNIGRILESLEFCKGMWDVMSEWEAIGRAVSRRTRGHARHVLNVFFLGYYFLYHPVLGRVFERLARGVVQERPEMRGLKRDKGVYFMAEAWFFAALFHDIGSCVEKGGEVVEAQRRLFEVLRLGGGVTDSYMRVYDEKSLRRDGERVVRLFGKAMRGNLRRLWLSSIEKGKPDHGIVAAAHLLRGLKRRVHRGVAREAARAVAIHNMFGRLNAQECGSFTWEGEPLGCLLLLCDQLQTWDRERGDRRLRDADSPQRAELTELRVEKGSRARVLLGVNYVLPIHLEYSRTRLKALRESLEEIIQDHPSTIFEKVSGTWPFGFRCRFFLNGELLDSATIEKGMEVSE